MEAESVNNRRRKEKRDASIRRVSCKRFNSSGNR